ncbi:MAG: hypothetical protein H7A52_14675 [Akkermansiaceae bacterium]|nr:hypothetical protein [Akkermansiaceae bacterium]
MKKMIAAAVAIAAMALVVSAKAEDKTVEGTLMCAKCKLSETSACADVLKVGDVTYYLEQDGKAKTKAHQCSGEAKAKVTGKEEERDGKKYLVVSSIEKE